MDKSLKYYGKIIPSSCAAILMSLCDNNDFTYPMFNYITTEVFNYQCIGEDRCKWFCTYPFGIEALYSGAKILGVEKEFSEREKTFKDTGELFMSIDEELKAGPFILGPIDNSSLWDTAESRYFKGYAQFVNVSGIQDGHYILDDPNGCPNLKISSDMFWTMVKNSGSIYFARFCHKEWLRWDLKALYADILRNVIRNRLKLIESPHNYLLGMQKLYAKFEEQGIKSSDSVSMKYILLYLSRSLYLLNEFIQSCKYYLSYSDHKLIISLNEFSSVIEDYLTKLNSFRMDVDFDNSIGKTITIQSIYEQRLNEIALKVKVR